MQEEVIRIAGRPAVGAQIADVEEIAGPDRAHRVAQVTVAHVGMTFAFDEDRLAAGGGFAAEQAREAAHRHRRGRPQPGGFKEGRGEVAEIHERVDLPRRRGRLAPADRERDPGALVIAIAETAGHLPTVVGAIDDQRPVEFARGCERRQHGGGFAVQADDAAVIIQQVEAHLFAIGQLGRNRQPGRIESGLPGVIQIGTSAGFRRRVGVAYPEEERLTRPAGLQESFKARELRADRVFFPAGDLGVAGRPRFALVADRIAGLAEQLRDHRRILREAAPERGAFAEFMDGAAGEQARAARRAGRRRIERMREQHAFLGDPIEGRRARVRIAEDARMGKAPVVAEDQQDVRTIRRAGVERGHEEQAESGGEAHGGRALGARARG